MPHNSHRHATVRILTALTTVFGLACSPSTEPSSSRQHFDLLLTPDSAYVYNNYACGSLYCFTTVAKSGSPMPMHLAFGPKSANLSPPIDGLGTIIAAWDSVKLADSLSGRAVQDAAGVVTVFVGPGPDASGFTPTDHFTLQGAMSGSTFAGRWRQQIDPHGLANLGSFTTVSTSAP